MQFTGIRQRGRAKKIYKYILNHIRHIAISVCPSVFLDTQTCQYVLLLHVGQGCFKIKMKRRNPNVIFIQHSCFLVNTITINTKTISENLVAIG